GPGQEGRHQPRAGLDHRDGVGGRRLGRLRRRQHLPDDRQAAVLRLRRGHRPAVGGRHRARGGGARGGRPGRAAGRPARGGPARPGVVWLLRAQEADGSWFGRWGANYVYGTGAVVPALIAAGVQPGKPVIRRAVAWLEEHQNPDGGWGEDMRSYDDPSLAGRGESTASHTPEALLALLAPGG